MSTGVGECRARREATLPRRAFDAPRPRLPIADVVAFAFNVSTESIRRLQVVSSFLDEGEAISIFQTNTVHAFIRRIVGEQGRARFRRLKARSHQRDD